MVATDSSRRAHRTMPLHRLDVPAPRRLPFAIGTFDSIGPLSRAAYRAYQGKGADHTFRTPYYRHHELPVHYQQFNRAHARRCAAGEHVFARLKSWRLLRRARCSTGRIGRAVTAVHTLLYCGYSG
ncbi:hypothetical protein AN217_04570 [Streptomyces qinglanensis]|uniref:DDE Tnp4 domain-containing protein n=1 Tax=Streptomyces qinglanensis TaxID=943816 RepID=A0A1E7K026_9ACTN|nr:hypothetical protein AN217_04570 [Streptomyces qinglanensis]OEV23050.1 hypothetical protein AN220_26530 [Streptomyces nanshensis]